MQSKNIIADKIVEALTKGVRMSASETNNEVISNYSPNNLKTIVLSQEGAILVYNTTSGSVNSTVTKTITFQQSDAFFDSWNEGKEALSVLVGARVYSAVEEIVIIQSTGYEPLYTLPARQFKYIQNKLAHKLKRLNSVIILPQIPMSLRDFEAQYKSTLTDDFKHLSDLDEFQNGQNNVTALKLNKTTWYKTTSMRPQYYTLDEKEGPLVTVFNRRRKHFTELEESEETDALIDKVSDTTETDAQVLKEAKKDLDFMEELADYTTLAENLQQTMIKKLSKETKASDAINDLLGNINIAPLKLSGVLNSESTKLLKHEEFAKFIKNAAGSNQGNTLETSQVSTLKTEMLQYIMTTIATIYTQRVNSAGIALNMSMVESNKYLLFRLFNKYSNRLKNFNEFVNNGTSITSFQKADRESLKALLTFELESTENKPSGKPDKSGLQKAELRELISKASANITTKDVNSMLVLYYLTYGTGLTTGTSTPQLMYDTILRSSDRAKELANKYGTANKRISKDSNIDKNISNLDSKEFYARFTEMLQDLLGIVSETKADANFDKVYDKVSEVEDTIEEPESETQDKKDLGKEVKTDEQESELEEEEAVSNSDANKSKNLIKLKMWSDKLKELVTTGEMSADLTPETTNLISSLADEYISIYNDNEESTPKVVKQINSVTLEFVNASFGLPEVTALIIFRKAYIKHLKTVGPIDSNGLNYPGVWKQYFNTSGEYITPDNCYKFAKLMYTIIKGRVK